METDNNTKVFQGILTAADRGGARTHAGEDIEGRKKDIHIAEKISRVKYLSNNQIFLRKGIDKSRRA